VSFCLRIAEFFFYRKGNIDIGLKSLFAFGMESIFALLHIVGNEEVVKAVFNIKVMYRYIDILYIIYIIYII